MSGKGEKSIGFSIRRGALLSAVFTFGLASILATGGGDDSTTYSVGGTVSGLSGTVVLQNNGGDNKSVSTSGSFTFDSQLSDGASYNVTVATQPSGQTCSVTNGSGTISGANVSNVSVDCVDNFTVGGTLSGVVSGSITLLNNGGNSLTLNSNGQFTFTTPIADGGTYNVTVSTPPTGFSCIVENESGTISAADVTNVLVSCTINTYPVGGSITGLTGSVTLQNNGADDLTTSQNGSFTFATEITHGQGYAVTVSAQPDGQNCTVSDDSGTINGAAVTNVLVTCADIASPTDVSGSWRGVQTITTATPQNSGTCDSSVGQDIIDYSSIIQSSQNLTLVNSNGVEVAGTIGATIPAAIALSGSADIVDPLSGSTYSISVSMSGTLDAGGIITGTMSTQHSINTVNTCYEEADITAERVYQYTGSEDYSGLYAIEMDSDTGRDVSVSEFDITGATFAMYDSNGAKSLTSPSFDAASGAFSAIVETIRNNTTSSTSIVETQFLTGLFVRADSDVSGLPVLVTESRGHWQEFSGLDGTGSLTGQEGYLSDYSGYGKPFTATAFNRNVFYRKSGGGYVEGIFVGLQYPPLKTANNLYVEVLSGSTRLCTALYSSRYQETRYLPAPDMDTEAFQDSSYSFVNCNTSDASGNHNVIDGATYTVRIMDTGGDGFIGGVDDTEVTSQSMVAALHPTPFADQLQVSEFVLDNNQPSQTMKRGSEEGLIELFGFIDTSEPMDLSWGALIGVDTYTAQITSQGDPVRQLRISTDSSTQIASIPADLLDTEASSIIRVVGANTNSGNGAVALSNSMYLRVTPGVSGVFNVELDDVVSVPPYWTFQVHLNADMSGDVSTCDIMVTTAWHCDSATVDYASNQVSLELSDALGALGGGPYTVVFNFTDSANGTVTSPDLTQLNTATTNVRLVNPELWIRSVHRSSGSNQNQTQVTMYNTFDANSGETFSNAIFRADDSSNFVVGGVSTSTSSVDLWNNNTAGDEWPTVVSAVTVMPVDDGEAQEAGNFVSKLTHVDWSLGGGRLASGLYAVVLDSANPDPKWVFKFNYTRPDASVLQAPILSDITLHIGATDVSAGVGVGDSGNPIDISSDPLFDITWTGATVTGGEWQLHFRDVATGYELRTGWMTDADAELTDNNDGTWTFINSAGPSIPSGATYRIHIRTRDSADTMYGVQLGADRVYVTNP